MEKTLPLPPTPRFVFVLTFFATLGGFLVGYDIGIVSGSMLFVRPYFHLSTIWTEAIVGGAVASAAVSVCSRCWYLLRTRATSEALHLLTRGRCQWSCGHSSGECLRPVLVPP